MDVACCRGVGRVRQHGGRVLVLTHGSRDERTLTYPRSVPVNDDQSSTMREASPDTRPLGGLALGFAVLSLFLAVSYFFSLLTYLAVALALPLGFIARGNEPTRKMGTAAVLIALIAAIVAPVVLTQYGLADN
jgi:hypothetical protein